MVGTLTRGSAWTEGGESHAVRGPLCGVMAVLEFSIMNSWELVRGAVSAAVRRMNLRENGEGEGALRPIVDLEFSPLINGEYR